MGVGTTPNGWTSHWQDQTGQFCQIKELGIEQQSSAAPGWIIKVGENFNYKLELDFSTLLGQLGGGGVSIQIGIYATDMSTGNVIPGYSVGVPILLDSNLQEVKTVDTDTYKRYDHTDPGFEITAVSGNTGIFQVSACVVVPSTGISTFLHGPWMMIFP
jgi:hypothetical protein